MRACSSSQWVSKRHTSQKTTQIKWERALRLTVQLDLTNNRRYIFTDCYRKRSKWIKTTGLQSAKAGFAVIILCQYAEFSCKTTPIHCKKNIYFQDLLSQHIFFCQINFIIIYLVEVTYYFEFLMIKWIYFIVLTHFFQFNQLKILRQPRLLTFLS